MAGVGSPVRDPSPKEPEEWLAWSQESAFPFGGVLLPEGGLLAIKPDMTLYRQKSSGPAKKCGSEGSMLSMWPQTPQGLIWKALFLSL